MGKLLEYLNKQIKTSNKNDAINCLKIYNKLKEINNGSVWSSQWSILVDIKFKGFPSKERIYKPSLIGNIFIKGINNE